MGVRKVIRFLKRRHIRNNYSHNIFYLNIGAGVLFLKKNWRILDYSDSKYKGLIYLIPKKL